jgi:hypothetical protein
VAVAMSTDIVITWVGGGGRGGVQCVSTQHEASERFLRCDAAPRRGVPSRLYFFGKRFGVRHSTRHAPDTPTPQHTTPPLTPHPHPHSHPTCRERTKLR